MVAVVSQETPDKRSFEAVEHVQARDQFRGLHVHGVLREVGGMQRVPRRDVSGPPVCLQQEGEVHLQTM